MTMEDVYAKLAKAREKKLKARQEQDEEKKQKKIARDRRRNRRNRDGDSEQTRLNCNERRRKCYNKKKKSKAPKASKKAPSNGDDEALNNCRPPKKQEVCGNADSGDEPPELLVRPGDEEDTDLEHEHPELLVRPGDEEETDYNDICGSCSSVNTNEHVVVEDVVTDDEDSSVHRFVDDGCVSNRTEINRCHSPVLVKKN